MAKNSGEQARPRATEDDFTLFAVTVDVILTTILRGELRVLLIQRGAPPHEGQWALPGGRVKEAEPLAAAAERIAHEVTGFARPPRHLEQLGAYGDPGRDPRMRVVTVAYWAIAPLSPPSAFDRMPNASGAAYAEFVPLAEIESRRIRLAFDHGRIVADALEWARSSLETTTVARRFCPREFTISQLREVYEAVWGARLDAANFQRRVLRSDGFIAPLDKWRRTAGRGGRPARLWEAEDEARPLSKPFRPWWRAEDEQRG